MSPPAYGGWILRWSLTCITQLGGTGAACPVLHRRLGSAAPGPGASPAEEVSVRSLTHMGFSESQARTVYEGSSRQTRRSCGPTLAAVLGLGLNPATTVRVLQKCPQLYAVSGPNLHQRIDKLRKLGFGEGSLQRVVSFYPQILCVGVKRLNAVTRLLREDCQFTAEHLTHILRDSPAVVQERLARVEYLFQYAYFRMGCRHGDMVKAKLFGVPLDELRCRHGFLERRGLYQTPDKKGQTLAINPPLTDVLGVSEEIYLTKVAKATQEEFDVFRKLLAREEEEEEEDEECSSDDDDDDDDDDGDQEEEGGEEVVQRWRHTQNTGYNRRKKQKSNT
ncbi:transcription termination factor 4, mitochondrial [Brachyhypopomus gauderio]|uniref:transcription termination factor 4, mitochondrial n=1 Tax=Brachyhypopomus gauderio TaxID=698409 RepID=UPI0040427789